MCYKRIKFGEMYLAVSIWDVTSLFALAKGRNHIAQRTEATVNVLCLLQALACSSTVAQTLTSCQVNQIESALASFAGDVVDTGELENENRVRPR
jgi:hypothetical protein